MVDFQVTSISQPGSSTVGFDLLGLLFLGQLQSEFSATGWTFPILSVSCTDYFRSVSPVAPDES